jgi:hypothetical protein
LTDDGDDKDVSIVGEKGSPTKANTAKANKQMPDESTSHPPAGFDSKM